MPRSAATWGISANDVDAKWALNAPEKIKSISAGAPTISRRETAKQVVGLLSEAACRRYFHGCSDGGREALNEAQRYPTDYDAIIAGAPAMPWTRLMTGFMADHRAAASKPGSPSPMPS
jgi:hypothetical protein